MTPALLLKMANSMCDPTVFDLVASLRVHDKCVQHPHGLTQLGRRGRPAGIRLSRS